MSAFANGNQNLKGTQPFDEFTFVVQGVAKGFKTLSGRRAVANTAAKCRRLDNHPKPRRSSPDRSSSSVNAQFWLSNILIEVTAGRKGTYPARMGSVSHNAN